MALKPWYTVITPRDDLREGRPLDAAEFAVHLDHVRDGRAPRDYQDAERFFDRTFLTQNLTELAAEVVRRLSGEKTQTSAVFNMTTQFGGGKTHALTLLYHLATNGSAADTFNGVRSILEKAGVKTVPKAAVAAFVGTEFDSITGRGGGDGTPLRRTPWGEIAYQLGGVEAFEVVREHEAKMIAPSGEVIRMMLPQGQPCIILMDELMNFINRFRKMGMANQLHSFLHNLSEVARAEDRVVLVVSIPASELEMTAEDHADYDRFKKLLNRVGKPVIMSTGSESSEIIRRRLFEWVEIPSEGRKVIRDYAAWTAQNRQQLPGDFLADHAHEAFESTYPFHPAVLRVFEEKWQTLPRFQQTRGILRLLALWISITYKRGYTEGKKDHLIDLGSAPLDDSSFRAAVFEQLGENKLEPAVTTDIAGRRDSRAMNLDTNSENDVIRKARLHQKVATVIFFESNGGQTGGDARKFATLPEIRFAVGRPDLDLGNVETVLDDLAPPNGACFHLDASQNRYWFSLKPNLVKIHADRMATVGTTQRDVLNERVRDEIRVVFQTKAELKPEFFPERSNQITDRPALTLVVLDPAQTPHEKRCCEFVWSLVKEYGTSARTYKSGLLFSMADNDSALQKEARKILAWEEINRDAEMLGLDESQRKQVAENVGTAKRDLREAVWRAYRFVVLLGKTNELQLLDLGPINSNSGTSLVSLILERLIRDDLATREVSPNFILRHWPPARIDWSTKAVRDMFFASPQFPRLINPEIVKDTIARGVSQGAFALVGRPTLGESEPFYMGKPISSLEIDLSEDIAIITADEAKRRAEPRHLATIEIIPGYATIKPGETIQFSLRGHDQKGDDYPLKDITWSAQGGSISSEGLFSGGDALGTFTASASAQGIIGKVNISITKKSVIVPPNTAFSWEGEIPPQKWMNFYTKVLGRFATKKGLTIRVSVQVEDDQGISKQVIEETKTSLRELGLKDDVV